jgi:hypothetical protein
VSINIYGSKIYSTNPKVKISIYLLLKAILGLNLLDESPCILYNIQYIHTKGTHDRVSYAEMIFIPLQFESHGSVRADDASLVQGIQCYIICFGI